MATTVTTKLTTRSTTASLVASDNSAAESFYQQNRSRGEEDTEALSAFVAYIYNNERSESCHYIV